MHSFTNMIAWKIPINISDTFSDISRFNRAITRNKLIFSGSSQFDIQFLYPLFSELTYSPSCFYTQVSTTSIYKLWLSGNTK
ncbi:MAG: hypothetical protein PF517_08115 [Salinivirgaceae bacterium]|jgi:hypothetical protein|nr:hypothetical protein [Salinivirgaceae bacterium]